MRWLVLNQTLLSSFYDYIGRIRPYTVHIFSSMNFNFKLILWLRIEENFIWKILFCMMISKKDCKKDKHYTCKSPWSNSYIEIFFRFLILPFIKTKSNCCYAKYCYKYGPEHDWKFLWSNGIAALILIMRTSFTVGLSSTLWMKVLNILRVFIITNKFRWIIPFHGIHKMTSISLINL